MENRHNDFYEGTTLNKLKNILDVVIYNLKDDDNFKGLIEQATKITAVLTWDGMNSLVIDDRLTKWLEYAVHILVESKDEMDKMTYRKIEQIIEPLEIVITEIKMVST